ncbi:proline racemase family protein [Sporosarcina ureilytica]|uniref:Proline racemase n=1 Tax=Sporosarcina ureilytica TaxID=298596 RepID=A0A1D8JIP1_9BACL|nr:proline racemase family protein [Sporosarcina ureilytica]AOV08566.1 hypothetical protein BI350_14165 [Sporosarcina ureilytica]
MSFGKLFSTIDTHVAGEAFRIVTNSSIRFHEDDVQAANDALVNGFEHERNLLLNEPRGHRGMHGCIVLPTKEADVRLLFFNHKGVSPFKYEGLLATLTALIETGTIAQKEDGIYTIETVQGIYTVKTVVKGGEVISTKIDSKTCSRLNEEKDADIVQVDNKRNYVIYECPTSIPAIELQHLAAIQQWGIQKTVELSNAGVQYEGVVLLEKDEGNASSVRSVTFEKDGYILRSPGIDTSFAILTSLDEQTVLKNESVFGSCLEVSLTQSDERGKQFSVATEAFVTGTHNFILDEEDPLKEGFLLA